MKRTTFGPRRPNATPAARTLCPLLGTVDQHGATTAPIDYPSFENRCLATPEGDQIILTEQATFCLSAAHRSCPRFMAAAAAHPERVNHAPETYPLDNGPAPNGIPGPGFANIAGLDEDFDDDSSPGAGAAQRQKWSWIGAAMIFVSTLLCGGIFAVYVGWQIANTSYVATPPGSLDTLSNAAAQPQIYLVVTATSEPQAEVIAAGQAQAEQLPIEAGQAQNQTGQTVDPEQLPPAVTPTPMQPATDATDPNNTGQNDTGQDNTGQDNTGQESQNPDLNALGNTDVSQPPADAQASNPQAQAPDPALNELQLEIPTRRPTPILDIPTSTPEPPAEIQEPEQIAVEPPPPQGTPMVLFSAADEILENGECTIISWSVENVRAVYFDSHGVDGHGEREVCMRERTSNYVLTVMYPDGSPHYFTQTIEYLEPTPTPTPTYTFTPEPYLTPTWTPVPPTSTPTPDIQYGAHLAAQSGQTVQCVPDTDCEVNLLVTNSGSDTDSIAIELNETGAWTAQICRPDGVCGTSSLLISGMGPGNTALVRLLVQVPSLEAAENQNYVLRAVSEGSGKTIGSNPLQITLEADP